jgi:hypothetical protein
VEVLLDIVHAHVIAVFTQGFDHQPALHGQAHPTVAQFLNDLLR